MNKEFFKEGLRKPQKRGGGLVKGWPLKKITFYGSFLKFVAI